MIVCLLATCCLPCFLLPASAGVSPQPVPGPLLVLGACPPAAAAALPTGSQEDEEEEGGDEDAEPEDAEHRQVLHTAVI